MYPPAPALHDPRTVLHVLSFKAALPLFLALLMPDCPQPATVKWLMMRTGIKTRSTVYDSLDFLAELGVATKLPGVNGIYRWQLSDKAVQLPLPVKHLKSQSAQSEMPSTQLPHFGSTQSHFSESTQSQREAVADVSKKSTPPFSESAQSQQEAADVSKKSTPPFSESAQSQQEVVAEVSTKSTHPLKPQSAQSEEISTQLPHFGSTQSHFSESAQSQQEVVAGVSTKSTHPLNDHDVNFKDHGYLCDFHHQHDVEVSKKSTPPTLEVETATSIFLHEIGLDDPVPQDYAEYPLEAAVGYWWLSLVRKMESPQGYLRRRMECGHIRPTDQFLDLAVSWLKLTEVQRCFLWKEATQAAYFGQGAYLQLPDDFPYVPFKPLLRLAYIFHKDKDDTMQFIPDSIAWEDDEFVEDDL